MSPWWATGLAAVVLGVLGHRTGRQLATGGYRIPEDEAAGPTGASWWPGPGAALLAGLATAVVPDAAGWAALPPFLLFAWLTVGLVWVDLDVHRLPVGLVVPGGVAIAVLLALAALAGGDRRWLAVLVGAALMGTVYLVLFLLPGGGLGGGDLRLAPLIGGLLGSLGLVPVVVGMLAGFVLGGLLAAGLLLARRVGVGSSIAYGPAMCAGAWVAVGLSSRIVTGVVVA
ncbi:prepilin peptidase [Phycicoccus endophyticus]|uniref:Prepilin peptidase n=1 Tax=Phycicoccus endophyticus TaxID=1690220 RepID=A0A7G9R476_9MICO|nr:prepilin peptidase [Phycicoccus endophyticus]NHI18253.1 prepilin peptidase [Phycicoccus endophyticus]QNN50401.1 prepilin peptidase [Phycicoccus endophyticus]GGL25195.1 hypothetical protein GCM10012283_04220 [Phycicoccus endophyticus]